MDVQKTLIVILIAGVAVILSIGILFPGLISIYQTVLFYIIVIAIIAYYYHKKHTPRQI